MTEEPINHKIILTPITGGHTDDSARTIADCGQPVLDRADVTGRGGEPAAAHRDRVLPLPGPRDPERLGRAGSGPLALRGVRGELNRKLGVAQTDQLFAEYLIREHDPEED